MRRVALIRPLVEPARAGTGLALCSPWECAAGRGPGLLHPERCLGGGSRPCTAKDLDEWLGDITHWRAERQIRIGYSAQRYGLPAFQWTRSPFIEPKQGYLWLGSVDGLFDRISLEHYEPLPSPAPRSVVCVLYTSEMGIFGSEQ
jgi:hypothetical protein